MQSKFSIQKACGTKIEVTERRAEHLQAHPELAGILPQVLLKLDVQNKPFMEIEVEMGKAVGFQNRVPTPFTLPTEQMTFAHRVGRNGPSHVVEDTAPRELTSTVTVILKRVNPKHFHFITAWVGTLAKKEPWDPSVTTPEDRKVSLNYWCKNALIYDPNVMGPVYQSTWKEELLKLNINT